MDIFFTIVSAVCCAITIWQTMKAKSYKEELEKSFFHTNLIELDGFYQKALKKISKFSASCTEEEIRGIVVRSYVVPLEAFLAGLKRHKTSLEAEGFLDDLEKFYNDLNAEIAIFVNIKLSTSCGHSDLIASGQKIYNQLSDISHKFQNIEISRVSKK